ncbi:hypothetical protein D3C86_1467460 [compost metagenome]
MVEMIPYDKHLSNFMLSYLFDYREINDKFKFDKNYIMKSGERKFRHPSYGKVTSKIKLVNFEKQSTEIVLDNSIIKYK